jgi:hypothetical protein
MLKVISFFKYYGILFCQCLFVEEILSKDLAVHQRELSSRQSVKILNTTVRHSVNKELKICEALQFLSLVTWCACDITVQLRRHVLKWKERVYYFTSENPRKIQDLHGVHTPQFLSSFILYYNYNDC